MTNEDKICVGDVSIDLTVPTLAICGEHWSSLQDALKKAGIFHFVKDKFEDAAQAAEKSANGSTSIEDFDPLMNAAINIANFFIANLIQSNNLHKLQGIDRLCPLCAAENSEKGMAEDWINGAVGDQVEYGKSIGAASRLQ
jgi:hypothetical protein